MKRLKIGMFVDNYFPQIDGVTIVIDNYARNLSKYADVVVIAPTYGKERNNDEKYPYKIIRVQSIKVPLIGYNLATPKMDILLKRKLLKEHFDIIHIHSPFSVGKLGVMFGKEENIPLVGTLHSQYKKDLKRYFKFDAIATKLTNQLMKVYNECDECYTVNPATAELFKEYGYLDEPIVIPNATDFERVKDDLVAKEIVNQRYGLNKNDNVLLFVGRINLVKNIMFIAEVLKVLKNKKFDYKMLFVGTGIDMPSLMEKISEYELEDNVIFCGEIRNREMLKNIYARAKLFVFPSLYDTNGLVQIEAASQKTPTIFLEGAIAASGITKDVNGYVASENPNKFADKIIEILKNKKLYANVCERSYKDVYKSYDKICKKLYARYQVLVKKKGR